MVVAASISDDAVAQVLREAHADDVRAYLTFVRRALHTIPEPSFEEHRTNAYIREQLDALGIPYTFPIGGGTGVLGRIGDGAAGPTVALRADMDALPIVEPPGLDAANGGWVSGTAGYMHACGHDAHMAMLLGAARLLKAREAGLAGQVLLVFQPGEEGKGGADVILKEGHLEGVAAISGIHVFPALSSGTVATKPGVFMAASDRFVFKIQGRGGHGAMPHLAADPVVAASALVMALQTLVSRETSPLDGTVVTVGVLTTGPGGACNIIPDFVEMEGTIRALSVDGHARLRARVQAVAEGTVAVYGCNLTVSDWSPLPYPPTINDPGMADMALRVGSKLASASRQLRGLAAEQQQGTCLSGHSEPSATCGGSGGVGEVPEVRAELAIEPTMAAEDFSFYALQLPAVFTFMGIGSAAKATTASLHNPNFQMDEDMLPLGSAFHVAMALEMLSEHAAVAPPSVAATA